MLHLHKKRPILLDMVLVYDMVLNQLTLKLLMGEEETL